MGNERPLFSVRQALQRCGYCRPLLIFEDALIGGVWMRHVEDSMLVSTLRISSSPH
jgi:hypothetical protein